MPLPFLAMRTDDVYQEHRSSAISRLMLFCDGFNN
jgi:hypothetical protein